jgi:hypothetical protein
MASNGLVFVSYFVKSSQLVQRGTQHDNLVSLLFFLMIGKEAKR